MDLIQSIKIVKALSDESRLLILNTLKEKVQYVEEIAERLNLAVSTVSFHLKKLEQAGLVNKSKEQYYVSFYINNALLSTTLNDLISVKNTSRGIQDNRIKKYMDSVLKSFLKNGKFIKLPAQYKKRVLIYEFILNKFSPGKVYLEKEVDRKISEYFDDYCTVRRALIDEKMMTRKNGEYTVNSNYNFQFPESNVRRQITKQSGKMNKSEIKRTYKLEGAPMGVYLVTNLDTGSKYLGSAKNINGMINRHKFELSTGIHTIPELLGTWKKSGEESIRFEALDKLDRKEDPDYNYTDDLKELESLWIEKLNNEGVKVFRLKNTRLDKA